MLKSAIAAGLLALVLCTGLWRVPWAFGQAAWQIGSATTKAAVEVESAKQRAENEVRQVVESAVEDQLELAITRPEAEIPNEPTAVVALSLLKLAVAVTGIAGTVAAAWALLAKVRLPSP